MATGLFALHPITGEKVPVWVANFVLMHYGTGAVMAVPAHDERDFEFAQKYDLPIKQVIEPANGEAIDLNKAAFTEHGKLVNSAEFNGLDFDEAFNGIADKLEAMGCGKRQVNYRLRDWGFSSALLGRTNSNVNLGKWRSGDGAIGGFANCVTGRCSDGWSEKPNQSGSKLGENRL